MDELRKGLSRCSVDPRATDVERLVTHMDARNGGRGGALRYEEFVAAALDAQRTLTAQTLSNIFCERCTPAFCKFPRPLPSRCAATRVFVSNEALEQSATLDNS